MPPQGHHSAVGFLKGTDNTLAQSNGHLASHRRELRVWGWWATEFPIVADRGSSEEPAGRIAGSGTYMLVVDLDKPRQDLWLSDHPALTGVRVLLAFRAMVGFLAGLIQRAPQAVADAGMEWDWRQAMEPHATWCRTPKPSGA